MRPFILIAFLAGFHGFSQASDFSGVEKLLAPVTSSDGAGMDVAIIRNGKTVYSKRSGLANIASKTSISSTTVFNAGSIAKQFTAACIWVLVRDNKISLTDDIRSYLPEMPVSDPPVLVQNLLNHSSGIRNYHTLMDLQGFDYDTEYYNNATVLEMAARQKPTQYAQRNKTSYSNTNYNLLALIIERVSGQNLNEFAARHIFRPLRMNATQFRISNKQVIANRAVSYGFANDKFTEVPDVNQESYGAGNLWTTADDLARWINMLNAPSKKHQPLYDFLTERRSQSTSQYAQGVMLDEFKGHVTIAHSGSDYGWNAYLVAVPDQKLGIVILCNSNRSNPTSLANSMLAALLEDKSGKQDLDPKANSRIDISGFPGRYLEINSDMQMDIFTDNDTLKSRGTNAGKGIVLLADGPQHFHRKNNPAIKYDFSKSVDCDLVISFGGNPFYFRKAGLPPAADVDVKAFQGDYYSEELQTAYRFHVSNGTLFVSYPNHPNVALSPVETDAFGNGRRTLYRFTRNENHDVSGLLLSSEGSVSDIGFAKR